MINIKRMYYFINCQLRKNHLRGNCVAGIMIGVVTVLKSVIPFCSFKGVHTINILEPMIVTFSTNKNVLIVLVGAVLLLADAPFIDGLGTMTLHRIKRRGWYIGNWIYILFQLIFYYFILWIVSILPFINSGYIQNMWSQTILRCMKGYTHKMDQYGIPQINIEFESITPLKVFCFSMILIVLYSLFLISILYVFNLISEKKIVGTIIIAGVHIITTILDSQGILLPFVLVKYNLFRNAMFVMGYNPKISTGGFSVCYFILLIYIIYLIGERIIRKIDFC